jgi:hypothetical protein
VYEELKQRILLEVKILPDQKPTTGTGTLKNYLINYRKKPPVSENS